MTGIVGSNEQLPVPAKDYAAPIPLQPELGEMPQTRDAALGVAVNGVPIYDYTGGGEMTPLLGGPTTAFPSMATITQTAHP
jgi:hypothetical protein